ncbi:hypothetical protein P4S68_03535 [Pseudoalteromonas sp. Hal099]
MALTTDHQAQQTSTPTAEPPKAVAKQAAQDDDEVKIISFGAPKQANFNTPQNTRPSCKWPTKYGLK